MMTEIAVYDIDANIWTYLHSFSFDVIRPADRQEIMPLFVISVDNELLAIISWCKAYDRTKATCIIRNKGLRGENKELVWQKAQIPPAFAV